MEEEGGGGGGGGDVITTRGHTFTNVPPVTRFQTACLDFPARVSECLAYTLHRSIYSCSEYRLVTGFVTHLSNFATQKTKVGEATVTGFPLKAVTELSEVIDVNVNICSTLPIGHLL